ncbi:hypothetical protein [Pseudonocardia sp.]|uniref:hypothetical protein n=1 Tax=Pseudonocardia sp. TaxID=60912 RepID=UPI003D0BF8FC
MEAVAPGGASGPHAERLALARGLLRRAEERTSRRGPAGHPDEALDGRMLPVATPLAALLPGGGLRLGGTVALGSGPGSTALLLALLAEASVDGAWIGVIGRPDLGIVAAAEAGLRLERLALVPRPGKDLVAVTAALLDGLDVVVTAVPSGAGMRAAERQRLAARARQRGAVLVPLGPWPGADVELSCVGGRWEGLDAGFGRLRTRRARVRARGRGLPPTGREVELLLPGPAGGGVEPVEVGGTGTPGGASGGESDGRPAVAGTRDAAPGGESDGRSVTVAGTRDGAPGAAAGGGLPGRPAVAAGIRLPGRPAIVPASPLVPTPTEPAPGERWSHRTCGTAEGQPRPVREAG